MDLLPTLVGLTHDGDLPGLAGQLDGRSLLPHLSGAPDHDEVVAEYLAEGAIAPIVMIRRGRHKFIHSPADPDQLFDLGSDPHEQANLAGDLDSAGLGMEFRREIAARWDLATLDREVRRSQQRRFAVGKALGTGVQNPLGLHARVQRLKALHPQPHGPGRPRGDGPLPAGRARHPPRLRASARPAAAKPAIQEHVPAPSCLDEDRLDKGFCCV